MGGMVELGGHIRKVVVMNEFAKLPPLTPRVLPLVSIDVLLAVGEVVMMAGEVPWEKLREFYERVVGLRLSSERCNRRVS